MPEPTTVMVSNLPPEPDWSDIPCWHEGQPGRAPWSPTDNYMRGQLRGAHRILTTARKLIAAGWTQGVSTRLVLEDTSSRVCYCASGAMLAVAYGPTWAVDAQLYALPAQDVVNSVRDLISAVITELRRACPPDAPWPYGVLPAWNDEPGRTQAEVLEMFDRAIANLDAQLGTDAEKPS